MSLLVDVIKKIGIFMIAAQAVIHFAPGQKYEKYIKLIVGIIILVQFVMPFNRLLGEKGIEWSAALERMEGEEGLEYLEKETGFTQMTFSTSQNNEVTTEMLKQMENEIKSKLNNSILEEKYKITTVTISINTGDSKKSQEGKETEYELDFIRIEMKREVENEVKNEMESEKESEKEDYGEKTELVQIEPVQIDKVEIGNKKREGQEENQEAAVKFRHKFSEILGIQEENMEVIVYGTDEETDG